METHERASVVPFERANEPLISKFSLPEKVEAEATRRRRKSRKTSLKCLFRKSVRSIVVVVVAWTRHFFLRFIRPLSHPYVDFRSFITYLP